ncbi:MAG: hypothetical protein CMQ24_02415 [Gammaproteobacteria bacterium]|nr:hypothetical protein [Gammaproteobacteria bacterium]
MLQVVVRQDRRIGLQQLNHELLGPGGGSGDALGIGRTQPLGVATLHAVVQDVLQEFVRMHDGWRVALEEVVDQTIGDRITLAHRREHGVAPLPCWLS